MAGVVPVIPRFKFTNSLGVPISGGSVDVYTAGTTTRTNTWQDKDLTTLNTNPIVLDANGECLLFVSSSVTYKFWLKDSFGVTVSGWPVDNISGASDLVTAIAGAAAAQAAAEAAQAAAELAETNAEAAQDATYAMKGIYSSTTTGLAATVNGQYFGVVQTYGAAADVYLNSAGSAVYQSISIAWGIGDDFHSIQIQERSPSLVPALPYTAYVDIGSVDAYLYDGRGVPNRRATLAMPRNVFHLSTGEISGNDSTLAIAPTQRYVAGPQGNVTAKRLQIGIAEVYDMIYNPVSRVFPAGSWTIAFQIKNNIAATHTVKYGLGFGSVTTGSCNNTFAKKTFTFTSDGVTSVRPVIFTDGVQALDVSVDEFQIYEGTTVPAFASEASFGSHARAFLALANTMQRNSVNGAVLDTTGTTPALIRVGTPAAGKAFTEGAFFAVVQTDRNDQNQAKVFGSSGSVGTWDISYRNGSVGGHPAMGAESLAGKELYVTSKGYRIVGSGFKSGGETFWFDNIPYARNTTSLGTQTLNNIGMFGDPYGGGGTPGLLPFKGKFTRGIILDQYPTDTQVDAIVESLAASHALTGEDPVHPMNYVIGSGDSQTQSTSISAQGQTWWYDFFDAPPSNTWHGKMLAVSGTQLNSGGSSGYSFLPTISEQVRAAVARGHRPIVTVLFGANGLPSISDLNTFWDTIRGYGAKVIAITVLPQLQNATFETNRLALNIQIRAASAHYDALADIGGDATIGAFTAPGAGAVETTYYKDGVHLKAAGNVIASSYIRPQLIALGI